MEVTGELLAPQTLTFLFTDIEGSTAMLRRLGAVYAELLSDHHRLIRAQLSAHDGREIDTQGDAFFAGEYGTELLAARSEIGETGRRHAAYYPALAEQAGPALTGPGAVAWLARLDAEHDNMRAALRWAHDAGDRATVLRLAAA